MTKAQFILLPPCLWTFSLFPGFYHYIQCCCEELECVPGGIGMKGCLKSMPRSKMGWAVGLGPLQLYSELWPKVIIVSSSNKSAYYFTFLPILSNVWFKFSCQFGGYERVHQFIAFTLFFHQHICLIFTNVWALFYILNIFINRFLLVYGVSFYCIFLNCLKWIFIGVSSLYNVG